MASFVWMRLLESTAERYDRGIELLSRGRIASVHRRLAELATLEGPGSRVLDLGCGTGGVALACAARGARVVGIDANAGMLEVARSKPTPTGAAGTVTWLQLDAMELEDRFGAGSFDAVTACLAFSEMPEDVQSYVLEVVGSRLVPGGRLLIADEVVPRRPLGRVSHALRRWPLALVTYLLTQTTTRPVRALPARIRAAGFTDVVEERLWADAFCIVRARTQGEERVDAAPSGSGATP